MFPRRIAMAVLSAALLLTATAGTAAATKPTPAPAPATAGERPLTPEEEALAAAKLAAAEAYVALAAREGVDLSTLACVTPNATEDGATIDACAIPQGFLTVSARDQTKNIYCGPAVGQVISNYSWAMAAAANKYTQAKIAGWMSTDLNGRTDAPALEDGLEASTAGSPRRPAGWDWVVINLTDTDRDGQFGDQLHTMVRSNISNSKMPLAIPVKPYAIGDAFHLSSWARPVNSVGHWIAAYGWVGLWTGTDSSLLYYTDSSRDEGGSTGKFKDPMRHIAGMIMDHTGRLVW
ncbi:MAG TPA: hypothetical protein VFW95_05860 [Candidatus Limnocylindria bacterium]|nr:hypothetical protein [Candidatus Limnocylindria bacterium]